MNFDARHGDMCISKVKLSTLRNMGVRTPARKVVLGLGESSGHSHDVLPIGETTLVDLATETIDPSSDRAAERERIAFQVVGEGAVITHEEHDPIFLEPTSDDEVYVRIIQKVTNPFTGRVEQVRD